jgi:hypothetical protein
MIIIFEMESMSQKILPRCVDALVALTKLNVNYAENISMMMGSTSFGFLRLAFGLTYAWKVDVLSQIPIQQKPSPDRVALTPDELVL